MLPRCFVDLAKGQECKFVTKASGSVSVLEHSLGYFSFSRSWPHPF